MSTKVFISAIALALAACSSNTSIPTDVQVTGTPLALDSDLLFVAGDNQLAYLLDVSGGEPKSNAQRIPLPPAASMWQRRSQHDEALVLCSGRRADAEREAAPATLVRIAHGGEHVEYELGTTPFNTLAQSEDGRYAIAFRTGKASGRTLDNPNELVVVDLDKAPDADGAVTRKTPDGLAHTLTSVLVSPTLRIAGQDRRLLVALSAAEITLFDLGHLERRATIVQLDETRSINPVQIVWSSSNPTLYVRATSSDNVFMFRFEQHDNDPLGNDFRPTVNPLSGGGSPSDMALFGTGPDERLLVLASGSEQVLVIDPSTSKTNTLKLKAAADHVLLFQGSSPSDPRVQTRALVYGGMVPTVSFVDPVDLSDSPEDKLETLGLTGPATGLVPMLEDGQALILQGSTVTLVSLQERTLTPIAASSSLTLNGALFDESRKRLWVGPAHEPWIGTLDLQTGMTDELRLDAAIKDVVPMFNQNRLAVIHDSGLGYVSLVDLDQADREHTLSLRGFLISGALDRGAQ
jgi:hypothetical protein